MTWPEHMRPVPPPVFPEVWASDWGEDARGLWMAFTYKGARQSFRWIAPGEFLMGSPLEEHDRTDSETQHEVTLSRGYWLAETTVTQALWHAVMGKNPSVFEGEDHPVDSVSWENAQAFITRLNEAEAGLMLRLPSEAEWEFACRAGSTGPFSFGEDLTPEQVNYDGNYPYRSSKKGLYRGRTVEVGSLPANGWELYEMHGNVWEWCQDWRGEYPAGPVMEPSGPASGVERVLRGGSWIRGARRCRSAQRFGHDSGRRALSIGFRLARDPAQVQYGKEA